MYGNRNDHLSNNLRLNEISTFYNLYVKSNILRKKPAGEVLQTSLKFLTFLLLFSVISTSIHDASESLNIHSTTFKFKTDEQQLKSKAHFFVAWFVRYKHITKYSFTII